VKKILIINAFEPANKTAGQAFTQRLIEDISSSCSIDSVSFYNLHSQTTTRTILSFKVSFLSRLVGVFCLPFLHPVFTSRFSFLKGLCLRRLSKNYDGVIFNFSQVLIYSLFINHPNKFFVSHDVITQNYLRRSGFFSKLNAIFIFVSEWFLVKTFNGVIFTFSNKDSVLISRWFSKKSLPVNFYLDPLILNTEAYENDRFLFYAAWGRRENKLGLIWFLRTVMPLVDKSISFEIIGPDISDEIIQAASSYQSRFIFHGFVDNPYIYLRSCKALLAPLFEGAGVKVKVIEALASGTLVIGTDVSFEGVDVDLLDGCVSCLTAHDFANSINSLAFSDDKKTRQKAFLDKYAKNTLGRFIKDF
jgi:glycosyltransferase involved in cell wall biosynthesis